MEAEKNIIQEIQEKQLFWYGHGQRMTEKKIPK